MHDSEHRNGNQIARFLGNVVYDHLKKKSKRKSHEAIIQPNPRFLLTYPHNLSHKILHIS